MFIVIPPHNEILLCFLETNRSNCFGSFSCNINICHILLGCSIGLSGRRRTILLDIWLLNLVCILILILVLDLMVFLGIVLWDSLLNGAGVCSQILKGRRMAQLLWFLLMLIRSTKDGGSLLFFSIIFLKLILFIVTIVEGFIILSRLEFA